MKQYSAQINIVVGILAGLGALLMPLIFAPKTLEFFEFNKLALLVVFTGLLTIAWAVKIIVNKKINFAASTLDVAFLAVFITFLLSTVFSIDKVSSIFGTEGRWFPSLFGLTVLIFFYYALSSNIDRKYISTILTALNISGLIATILSIISYYGIFLGPQTYLRILSFSTTGSSVTGAILAALTAVLGINLLVRAKNSIWKTIHALSIVVGIYLVAVLAYIPAIAVLIIGVIATLFFNGWKEFQKEKLILGSLSIVTLVLVLALILPVTRGVLTNENFVKEERLSPTASWLVSVASLREYPFLGTGPSTFYLNFTRYRPVGLNATNNWQVAFDNSYNELFNIVATMGIPGILAVLFLGNRFLKIALAKVDENKYPLRSILSVLIVTLLATYLFSTATVLNTFLLFMMAGLMIAYLKEESVISNEGIQMMSMTSLNQTGISKDAKEYVPYLFALPLIAITLIGWYEFSRQYIAEYYMRSSFVAAQANDNQKMWEYQQKAINTYPSRDYYHLVYSQTNTALASLVASKENITEDDKKTFETLISQAVRHSEIASSRLNPTNSANWANRGRVYKTIITSANNAADLAIESYTQAVRLDPTNPRILIDMGGVYYLKQDYLNAANLFRRAISLKADYANAYFNYAQALINLKEYASAKSSLQTTQRLIETTGNKADYDAITKQIEELDKIIATQAVEEENKPLVEELLQNNLPQDETPTNQGPLTTPESTVTAN